MSEDDFSIKFKEGYFDCQKCYNILDDPHQCKNCGKNLCKDCIEIPCFFCKKGNSKNDFQKNIQLFRFIENFSVQCKYCKKDFTNKKELKDHVYNNKCPVKIYVCNVCNKYNTDEIKIFWNHIQEFHKKELTKKLGI